MLPDAIKSTAASASPVNGETRDSKVTSSNTLWDPLVMMVVQVIHVPPGVRVSRRDGGPSRTSKRDASKRALRTDYGRVTTSSRIDEGRERSRARSIRSTGRHRNPWVRAIDHVRV